MSVGAVIRKRFPDRVPIVLNKHKGGKDGKFLAPESMSVREFNCLIRQRLSLPAEKALFIFVATKSGSCIPSPHETLLLQYVAHSKEDGCLHMTYSGENTFGYMYTAAAQNNYVAEGSCSGLLPHPQSHKAQYARFSRSSHCRIPQGKTSW